MPEDPPADVNHAAPTSVTHIIGQPAVVEQVKVALDAAFADNRASSSPRSDTWAPPAMR